MEIKFLEDSTENSIHYESFSQKNNICEFEEMFVLDNKKIVYIKWNYQENWNDTSSDNYLQPAIWELESREVEILSISDIEGNEKTLTKKIEKKIKDFLLNIDYSKTNFVI